MPGKVRAVVLLLIALFSNTTATAIEKEKGESDELALVSRTAIYEVGVRQDIVYGKALSHNNWNSDEFQKIDLLLDIYRPLDTENKLPVIFLFHGGGFIEGSKQDEDIVELARSFASRGFLVLTPNYRLAHQFGTLPERMHTALAYWPDFLQEKRDAYFAMYPASRDAKAAVRWLYANADALAANTYHISALGHSAGALLSIVLGSSDAEHFRDEIPLQQDPSLKDNNLNQSANIHTVISRWGGPFAIDIQRIFFKQYPYDRDDAPMQIVHGTMDMEVPFFEAIRLAFHYYLNDIAFEFHTLHWTGHNALGKTKNGKTLDELALEFILKTQSLALPESQAFN